IDLDRGDLTAGEAEDEQPALAGQAAQRVGEALTADRIHDDVDAAAVGEPAHLVAEAIDRHDLVRPGRPGDLVLCRCGHDRDHLRPIGRSQLAGGGPDAAGRAVHRDYFALLGPGWAG